MNELINKETVKRVQDALKKFDNTIEIQILDNSAHTAIDASNALSCEVGAIVKSLLLRKNNLFFLCLISGDKKCSLNKVKKITNVKDVSLANANDVKMITGFTIGGVSPVGLKNNLDIFIDDKLSRFNNVYAAAGHPNVIFKISFNKLIQITSGKIMDISE